ncbi:hypothetical protein HanRHA438_Chr05g0204231 [Helianthus annuus]|nr:hypothetical protein HanRHA438_Chr05g0204231 [Helianthus annuus]
MNHIVDRIKKESFMWLKNRPFMRVLIRRGHLILTFVILLCNVFCLFGIPNILVASIFDFLIISKVVVVKKT